MKDDERDWAGDDYVRVYQSTRKDPKFAKVYDDDRLWAAYVRLLMDADPLWPAPASLPGWLSRYAREGLVKAGILVITGNRYTLSGLDKERRARAKRYGPDGSGRPKYPSDFAPDPESDSGDISPHARATGAGASASVSDSDSSYEETGSGRSGGNGNGNGHAPLLEAIGYLEMRTGRPWAFGEGSKPWSTLQADVRDFTWPAVRAEMEREPAAHPDIGQLVFGASRRLHPISSPPSLSRAEQAEAEAIAVLAAAADGKAARA